MAEKKMTAAEQEAAEEAAATAEAERADRQRLWWAAAFMAAVVVFVAGYAVGNATADEDVAAGDRPAASVPDQGGPFSRGGDRAPGPRGRFQFDFPDDLPFPTPGQGFEFDLECTPDGTCTFHIPEAFDLPRGPFGGGGPGRQGPSDQSLAGERGFLGVSVVEGPSGVTIAGIDPGSPADAAGIEPGDVFVAIDDVAIASIDDLVGTVIEAGAGTQVTVTVDRDGSEMSFDVILTTPPS